MSESSFCTHCYRCYPHAGELESQNHSGKKKVAVVFVLVAIFLVLGSIWLVQYYYSYNNMNGRNNGSQISGEYRVYPFFLGLYNATSVFLSAYGASYSAWNFSFAALGQWSSANLSVSFSPCSSYVMASTTQTLPNAIETLTVPKCTTFATAQMFITSGECNYTLSEIESPLLGDKEQTIYNSGNISKTHVINIPMVPGAVNCLVVQNLATTNITVAFEAQFLYSLKMMPFQF